MNSGAKKAAAAQKEATQMSIAAQEKMFGEMKQILAPYVEVGNSSLQTFMDAIPELTQAFNPSMESLAKTPGYQFQLGEGLRATQNSFAAKGLANSGAALKGAATFAEGLAGQRFDTSFNQDMAQKGQEFNMLMAPVQMGANAAAMTGGNAMQLGTNMGNTYQNQGNQLSSIYMNDAAQKNNMMGTFFGGLMGFL